MEVFDGAAMSKHYAHMESSIKAFFAKIGWNVELEPWEGRGPDIISTSIVGEIKHSKELRRDLSAKFWRDWDDPRQSFGGKREGERLTSMEHLETWEDRLSPEALGFVAVILGQLKHGYVMKAGTDNGWLIVEDVARWLKPLNEALSFIGRAHKGLSSNIEVDASGIGYVNIRFFFDGGAPCRD